ncbi:hypothetical protein SCUCBS95973_003834 [Sporothrix curviconia]|uniref:sn-1-specific diacylglycerol lipase n=1 Tax=Sporothrix curviconia TaxID=1260050 RepID=A0ABP0BIY7_9PEZI
MEVNASGTEETENVYGAADMDAKLGISIDMHGPPPAELGNPLLPPSLARSISLGTGTIRGAVRTARTVGRVPFYAAQYTTAVSIELSRRVLDASLGQTGRNLRAQCASMARGPGGELDVPQSEADQARMEAVVRSTSEAAQRGFNYLQVVTAAGFELAGSSVGTLMDVSEVLLMLLNNTLGSTESSRALRSIIQFLSQEFQNPATGLPGERVGVRDLLWGVCGLVYLQNVCQRQDDQMRIKEAPETVIWDVVVLDGQRVDVHESSLYGMHSGSYQPLRPQGMVDVRNDNHDQNKGVDGTDLAESLIRSQVLAAMSSDAKITVSSTTTKTVTVDITGSHPPPPISPPAGVELVELGPLRQSQGNAAESADLAQGETTYRIVFRINADSYPAAPRSPSPTSDTQDTAHRIEQVDDELSDTPMNDVGPMSTGLFSPEKPPLMTSPDKPMEDKPLPASPAAPVASPVAPATPASSKPFQQSRQPLQTLRAQPSTANQKKAPQVSVPGSGSAALKPPSIPGRGSSSQASPAAAAAARALPTTAATATATAAGSDKKASSGLRAAFKKPALGNLLHKDPPLSYSTKSTALDPSPVPSSTARKSAIGRTMSPSVTLTPPAKKTKTSSNARSGGNISTTDTTTHKMQTQMVRTPLTSGALNRHETPSLQPPTPGRDGDPSPFSGPGFSPYRGKHTIPDDLRSLASLASLASSFADSVTIHNTQQDTLRPSTAASPKGHKGHKSRANRGSIYTLHTNDSQGSLVLSSYGAGRRAFLDGTGVSATGIGIGGQHNLGGASQPLPGHTRMAGSTGRPFDMLHEVQRSGRVPGMFPPTPLAYNLQRYMRFSSAAYGHDFLRAMSITAAALCPAGNADRANKTEDVQDLHHELVAYAQHTGVSPADVVMASFIDAKGGPDVSGLTRMPLVHYITLDHASKAVVLACRGTLGFEDILADMACEYDDLYWRGRTYQVHKGVHASARRILYGGDGRVLATLRDALLKYPDYGLVLCGHSLGGAVTALLGVMLSEPRPPNTSGGGPATAAALGHYGFQTKSAPLRLLAGGMSSAMGGIGASREIPSLPPGRPVHVFAFGPPGTMTPALCKMTRGLITSLAHGNDIVPYLSLGVLHDLQAVALAFKTDKSHASAELWNRLWDKVRATLTEKVFGKATARAAGGRSPRSSSSDSDSNKLEPEDAWAYSALKTLRASMLSPKLLPPGEVLVIEMQRVLQRTSYGAGIGSGRTDTMLMVLPAQRVIFKHVCDVEARFREIKFSLAAFMDHSPGRYERALDQLVAGL